MWDDLNIECNWVINIKLIILVILLRFKLANKTVNRQDLVNPDNFVPYSSRTVFT